MFAHPAFNSCRQVKSLSKRKPVPALSAADSPKTQFQATVMSTLRYLNELMEKAERLNWEHWTVIGVLAAIFCLFCLRSKPYG